MVMILFVWQSSYKENNFQQTYLKILVKYATRAPHRRKFSATIKNKKHILKFLFLFPGFIEKLYASYLVKRDKD